MTNVIPLVYHRVIASLDGLVSETRKGKHTTVSVSTTKTTTAVVTESKTIELPAEAEKLIVKLNDLRSAIKHLEELEKSVKTDILVELNGAEEGLINGVVRITAKEQTRSGVDAKKLKEVFPEAASMCATSSTYLVIKTK